MRRVAFFFTCLAYLCHWQRIWAQQLEGYAQSDWQEPPGNILDAESQGEAHRSGAPEVSYGMLQPLRAFAQLVLSVDPVAAFDPLGAASFCRRQSFSDSALRLVMCSGSSSPKLTPKSLLEESPRADDKAQLRVCTACSCGPGDTTADTLQFLTPRDGPEVVESSCLARCDRGVPVMKPSGEIAERVVGPEACAELLRELGFSIDERLPSAYTAAQHGDNFAAEGRDLEALAHYKRAFSLALTGFGLKWHSKPSSIVKLLQASGTKTARCPFTSNIMGMSESEQARARAAAKTMSPAQIRWFARTMISRSQLYSRQSRLPEIKRRTLAASRRALEDAMCAVRLAEICVEEAPKSASVEPVLTGAWERLAECHEGMKNIEGAIYAYEQLLSLEPPAAPGLPANTAAKRAAQKLVLDSHRRGMQDTKKVTSSLQQASEKSRLLLTARAISDAEELRKLVEADLKILEDLALRAQEKTQSEDQLDPIGARIVDSLADRSLSDVGILREMVRSDINRLELTLMRGDPLFTFIRDMAGVLRPQKASRQRVPQLQMSALSQAADITDFEWLREQFEEGAWPKDQRLVSSLVDQAKRNPELVQRLVSEVKDTSRNEAVEEWRCQIERAGIGVAQALFIYLLWRPW